MKKLLLKFRGFSLIELEVTLVILAVGLFGFAGILKVYSQQISYIEKCSEPNLYIKDPNSTNKEYWISSHYNNWVRQFVLADILEKAPTDSQPPVVWKPDVEASKIGICDITATSAYSYDQQTRVVSVNINVVEN